MKSGGKVQERSGGNVRGKPQRNTSVGTIKGKGPWKAQWNRSAGSLRGTGPWKAAEEHVRGKTDWEEPGKGSDEIPGINPVPGGVGPD